MLLDLPVSLHFTAGLDIFAFMKDNTNNFVTRQTLLEKIKNKHDENSWKDFVFYYEKYIYIICRKMNLNHHDAEETVQKVLLRSWKKLPEFNYDDSRRFRGWLCNLTKMCVKDFYRSVKKHNDKIDRAMAAKEISLDNSVTDTEIDAFAEEEWITYITTMAFANIKDKISPVVIEIFEKLTEGKKSTDIAEEMGIPPNTVRVYKKRVISKLRDEINRLNNEVG